MPNVAYLLRRVRESLGQDGVVYTVRKVMREVGERICPPWQCLLWMPLPIVSPEEVPATVLLRVISEPFGDSDLAILERSLGTSSLSVFQARVRQGCQLCVLFRGQAVAGTLFFVFGRSHRFQHLVLSEQDAVILDARISPEFRGQGLYSIFLNLSLLSLKGKEIERVFVATSEHNEPSIRALRRVGFRHLMRYKTWMGVYKYDVNPL